MRLLALGVDYRSAPASVREALAFDAPKQRAGLDLFAQTFPGNEFVILSTCNRVEVYVAGNPEQVPELDDLTAARSSSTASSPKGFPGTLSAIMTKG